MNLIELDHNITKAIQMKLALSDFEISKSVYLEDYQIELFSDLHLSKAYSEFESWFNKLTLKEPIGNDIVALNLGLFESNKCIQLYLTGSRDWDKLDSDWACANDYFPKNRYADLKIFKKISRIHQDFPLDAIYFSLLICVILVNSFLNKNATTLLKQKEFLYLAAGFDDGDLYNLGMLTVDGLGLIQ